MAQGQGGEKRRLEQFLLQSRASNVIMIDPTVKSLVNRFEPQNIDRLRLFETQRLAGKVEVSEKLKKAQKKKKKKAKKSKALRGDLARNLTEIRRSEKGERRDKDTEEPRIVGDPAPPPAGAAGAAGGFAYDPVIETRRLDLQEALADQRRIEGIADRAAEERRFQTEIGLRRGELAGARADRRAGLRALGPREDADPIPEIIRLGERLRGDYDAFGQEQDRVNREVLGEVREQINLQERRSRDEIEAIVARQQAQDQNIRDDVARQDARFREIHERLGAGEQYLSEGREQVVQEIRAAEERLRGAQRDLDRPTSYDDVLLAADRPRQSQSQRQIAAPVEEPLRLSPRLTPSPSSRFQEINEPDPEDPVGIGGVIAGGGELNLPGIVIEQPGRIEPSARASGGLGSPLVGGGSGESAAERLERLLETPSFGSSSTQSSAASSLGIPEERLRRGGGSGTGQYSEESVSSEDRELDEILEAGDPERARQFLKEKRDKFLEEQTRLAELSPREVIRRGRLAIEEAAEEEAQEVPVVPQARLRLTDTQDFLGGFDRPASPAASPQEASPQRPRPLRPDDLFESGGEVDFLNPDEVGLVQDRTQANLEDSKRTYEGSFETLNSEVRPGPTGERGSRRGKGFRVRNNTDRTYKKIEPGDVVDVIGAQAGNQGQGTYVLDTGTATGSRVGLGALDPLIKDGSLLFEKGHRHELGGHFEAEPYGPPPAEPQTPQQREEEQESEELQAQIREGEDED